MVLGTVDMFLFPPQRKNSTPHRPSGSFLSSGQANSRHTAKGSLQVVNNEKHRHLGAIKWSGMCPVWVIKDGGWEV